MIIYFANRKLEVMGQASTSLPGGFKIVDDKLLEEIDTGISTFSFTVTINDKTREELESIIQVGYFVFRSGARLADDETNNTYTGLFQIIETEYDTENCSINVYAEDAGLELINKVCGETTLTNRTLLQMLQAFVPNDWTINLVGTPTEAKTYAFEGENTATERINSVAGLFDCEVFYSFEIKNFAVSAKIINVLPKRGNQNAVEQLRLNKDINKISYKKSITDIATAFAVSGSALEGSDEPITLVGYQYSYTDPDTGDVYSVDTATGQMRNTTAMKRWASAIDNDGLIVKSYNFDTTDKAVLAGQARAQLQKDSSVAINYTIDFALLPDDVQIGDRVYIIDEGGELYLEARMLTIETCVTDNTQTATVGEYVIKDSGISTQVRAIVSELKNTIKTGIDSTTIEIFSNNGNIFHGERISTTLSATVYYGSTAIKNIAKLQEIYGPSANIKWYRINELLGTGFTYTFNSNNSVEQITARLEI